MLLHVLQPLAIGIAALTSAPGGADDPSYVTPAAADTASYRIDVGHSELSFRIRHLMSRVNGTFNEWSGVIMAADPADWSTGSVEVIIQAASIDTRHEKRDSDLRSDSFFDAANHPTITFRSTDVAVNGTAITVTGNLTMRGITRPVVLTGEFLGRQGAGTPRERVGFSASGTLDRTDFGIVWNRAVEGGGVLLGDEVELTLGIEAVRM